MDYEKKYKEALEVAQRFYNNSAAITKKGLEDIFPELAENEDERIRKGLIEYFLHYPDHEITYYGLKADFVIAWLEKQGEQKHVFPKFRVGDTVKAKTMDNFMFTIKDITDKQYVDTNGGKYDIEGQDYLVLVEQKPANKVEPKFHEGEWIIHHGTENIYQVVAIIDNQYQLKYGDNYTIQNCIDVDRCARLWDIAKDAKDSELQEASYYIPEGFHAEIESNRVVIKRGEQKPAETEKGAKGNVREIPNSEPPLTIKHAREVMGIEQKPAWSEEDKDVLEDIEEAIINYWHGQSQEDLLDWLKSLKGRVQPQQEWSEEDRLHYMNVLEALEYVKGCKSDYDKIEAAKSDIAWLKSLRPQKQWKPSDEQMDMLAKMCSTLHLTYGENEIMESIYDALKKLKG